MEYLYTRIGYCLQYIRINSVGNARFGLRIGVVDCIVCDIWCIYAFCIHSIVIPPPTSSGDAAWALTPTRLDTGGALGKGSQVPGRSAGPQPVGAEPTLCTAPSALDLRFIQWTMSS